MKRFLILTQYYPPEVGAAQVRLSAFARELCRAGHDVQVVTALPSYPSGTFEPADRRRLVRREVVDGIPVTRLWLYPATGAGVKRLVGYLSFALTGMAGAVAARRPDVVFVESPPLFLGAAGWLAAKRFGAKFVLNVSDLWPDSIRDLGLMADGKMLDLAGWLELWLYRRADAVTAVTEGIRTRLIEQKKVPERQVLFLPNGVDLEAFRPPARVSPPTGGRPAFLYTGNHGYAQALDVIIDAATHAPEIDFILVGSGSEKQRLTTLAAQSKAGNVQFREPVQPAEIGHLYAEASGGIASLRASPLMEGARPAKVLAIMACARPVLYSGAGEGAALVRSAGAGIVVPPEDPVALASAARQMVEDPEGANQMGRNGRQYVEEHLSWPALVGDWLGQLETVP